MPTDIRPKVGRRFTFQAAPAPGGDGVVQCEVRAAEPAALLCYTWRGGSDTATGYGYRLDTTVTWTLTRTPDGGRALRLAHAGFAAADRFAWDGLGRANVS